MTEKETVDTTTVENSDGTTEVHVNVEEESTRGKIASWIVTGMGALSALAAAAATASVGFSSTNTSNALQDLATNADEQTYMQLNLAHQEQVLPVRLELIDAKEPSGFVPEGYALKRVTLTNPGDAMLMDATIHLPADSLVRTEDGEGDEVLRTNTIDAGVVVDEYAQLVLVPEDASAEVEAGSEGGDGVGATFTTSWDPRERWSVAADGAPVLRSCVFPGGDEADLEVALRDVSDVRNRTWIGCDAVYDDAVAGGLDGIVDGVGLGNENATGPARGRQTGDGAFEPGKSASKVLSDEEVDGLGGEVLVDKH